MPFIGHYNAAFFLCGNQFDGKGLDNGNQCHIGIGGNSDSPDVLGMKHLGNQQGSGTVRSTDNGDGCGIRQRKAEGIGNQKDNQNTKLGGCAEEKEPGLG